MVEQTNEKLRDGKTVGIENEGDRNLEREKIMEERGGKTKRWGRC